ncbi:MAG TPA: hypothetical protein IGS53_14610 [Leptolyngbyaceae cyanobacterium M33_DOE_097]|uniref:HNH endonuclease n=1 Tax=Oscillatoriales cyanobacterium SpSt-418 TaxID=2282169 RepID=A0A7C3KH77_9CYAN|nr:hypothetical protein [Leptolyngbyaceae cyanobacterium M33_DOE_097]
MAKIYIPSRELIKTLNISGEELIQVEKFFDSIPDDEWELAEGKDYRVVSGSGLREYTESGAYTIARYLETTKYKGFWNRIKEFIFHTNEKIRKSFVRRKILENCSSLIKRNDQFWISRSDAVAIFGTRSDYLSKMAEHTQKADYPLIKGQDFEDFPDQGLYFSLAGIIKLSKAFEERLTKKNRKAECKDVGEVIKPQIDDIVSQLKQREKQIESAKKSTKRRDKSICQVTKREGNYVEPARMAAHHLYSCNKYPILADSIDNLITISCEVHDQFHSEYMGGTNKECTIDNFISFVQQYYPDNTEVVIWLENQKRKLGEQKPIGKANPPHVLYLPYSAVS